MRTPELPAFNPALFGTSVGQLIQHVSSTGSFCWHVSTNEVSCSEEVCRIFACERIGSVRLEELAARVHLDDACLFQRMVDQARDGLDLDCEYRLRLPDNSIKHVRVVANSTKDRDGQVQYIGVIQDVTQRRVSEAALDKMRSELTHLARIASLGGLTASIAHEVNQPLTGVITNASACLLLLASNPPNVDSARQTLQRAIRDSQRAAKVVSRLRALFSKKSAVIEPVNLNEAALEVTALMMNELRRRGAVLRLELAEGLPPVLGDRVQLQQVILNLLLNAAEAMNGIEDRMRQLILKTQDEGERVQLCVVDAGVGIEQPDIERLFDAFYTTKSDGMGIGLSVSRAIVERYGGRLWARANVGPGATFLFSLPKAPDWPPTSDVAVVQAHAPAEDQTGIL